MAETYTYKNWNSLKEHTDRIVHTVSKISLYDSRLKSCPAYVTRRGSSKNMYEVFISPFAPGKSLLIHEYGHIRFQHLKYEDVLVNQVKEKFKAAWPNIKKYIDFKEEVLYNAEDIAYNNFIHIVQNHAMDMEVNSKLFEDDERKRVNFEITKERFDAYAYFGKTNKRLNKILQDFLKRRKENKEELLVKPIWPEDYGFPKRLFWHQYIDLILQNPEKLLKDIAKEADDLAKIFPKGFGKRGSVADQISENPLAGDKIISAEDIERLADSLDDIGTEGIEKVKESKYQSTNIFTENDNASIRSQLAEKFNVVPLGRSVENFIQKYTIQEYKEFKMDPLYNYNRGKSGNVLRSKTVENPDYYLGNCYVIVDTSGSIGSEQLNKAVALFKSIKNRVGQKSKVIWFDTDLQRIDKLGKVGPAPRGGSNDMGAAIDFVNKWAKKGDVCFIISDFYDTPDKMIKAINKFKGNFYGIKWTNKYESEELKKNPVNSWYKQIYDICNACDDFILVDAEIA